MIHWCYLFPTFDYPAMGYGLVIIQVKSRTICVSRKSSCVGTPQSIQHLLFCSLFLMEQLEYAAMKVNWSLHIAQQQNTGENLAWAQNWWIEYLETNLIIVLEVTQTRTRIMLLDIHSKLALLFHLLDGLRSRSFTGGWGCIREQFVRHTKRWLLATVFGHIACLFDFAVKMRLCPEESC